MWWVFSAMILTSHIAALPIGASAQVMTPGALRQAEGEVCYEILLRHSSVMHAQVGRLWNASRDLTSRGTLVHGDVESGRQTISEAYEVFERRFRDIMYSQPDRALCEREVVGFNRWVTAMVDGILNGHR